MKKTILIITTLILTINLCSCTMFNPFQSSKKMLPSPLVKDDGSEVSSLDEWEKQREYIKTLLEENLYGKRPEYKIGDSIVTGEKVETYGNTKYYKISFGDNKHFFRMRITVPESYDGNKEYPVILRFESVMGYRYSFEDEVLKNDKYVVATVNHLDLAPEEVDQYEEYHISCSECPAIMSWAYGASLAIDFLETQNYVDKDKIALTGHSRTGKAVICAAAYDDRIKLVIPNNSGAGGASSLRRIDDEGEQAVDVAVHQPNWFVESLQEYVDNPEDLNFDMNFALSLISPRPILLTESRDGGDSLWAGPKGTCACWSANDEIYKMYNCTDNNLIHFRDGEHNQTEEDFELLVQFCDKYFYGDNLDLTDLRVDEFGNSNMCHSWSEKVTK